MKTAPACTCEYANRRLLMHDSWVRLRRSGTASFALLVIGNFHHKQRGQLLLDYTHHPRIKRAAQLMAAGGIAAYPTESVWGLGCDPDNAVATTRILALKKRNIGKGLILVAASVDMFKPYLSRVTTRQYQMMTEAWPGPVTWLVPDNEFAPRWITGGQPTLALRVTAHPIAAALSRAFRGPLVSTSANPQGLPEARTLTKVKVYFGNNIDAYVPGKVGKASKPSEIRDLISGAIIRPGG